MKLVNKSALSNDDIRACMQGYPITIEVVDDLPRIEDAQGVFVDDARGLLVTDESYKNYGGLTYEYGATSAYDIAGTLARLGEDLGKRVCALRIVHECGHHFALKMDSIDEWFEQHPILSIIYNCFGHPIGESRISCWIQEMYYQELFSKIENEEKFDTENNMDHRTYNGILKN